MAKPLTKEQKEYNKELRRTNKLLEEQARHDRYIVEHQKLEAAGAKITFKQYKKQNEELRKKEERSERIKKKQVAELKTLKEVRSVNKKTRDLAREHTKFLKSNTGQLLEQLNIAKKDSNLVGAAQTAADDTKKSATKTNIRTQKGWNLAIEARKEAQLAIEAGSFDPLTYANNLETALSEVRVPKKVKDVIIDNAKQWGEGAQKQIKAAGGAEDVSKKLELSKGAMQNITGFEDKAFKIKSFFTDPAFRKIMIKGFFIGTAVKFAKDLLSAFTELGVSFSSLPLAAGLAKDEAKALLDEFGSLEGVTSTQLLHMKLMSKIFGTQSTDMAKIMQLQESTTNLTKQQALNQQWKWITEIRKEGLSANKIFADMASNAEFMAQFTKDGGKNILEAAKHAAKLGLSLAEGASMANKLLDWESSIEAEMEASMLLGRQINLDKARQLAFTGDIEQMMKAVKNQVGGEAEFNRMNVVQRQALADAIGLSGDNLAKFMKDQNNESKAAGKNFGVWGSILGGLFGLLVAMKTVMKGIVNPFAGITSGTKDLIMGSAMVAGGTIIGGTIGAVAGRASGGPVRAGNPYIVGEKGSELFVPMTAGHIIPHMQEGTVNVSNNLKVESQNEQIIALLSQANTDRVVGTKKLGSDIGMMGTLS